MSQSASLVALIADARAAQASDLHLEAGLSPCLRVRGQLRDLGPPIGAQALLEMARATAGETRWAELQERRGRRQVAYCASPCAPRASGPR
jgi:Tfp pilus assembly pilus retraction ATPase PilT